MEGAGKPRALPAPRRHPISKCARSIDYLVAVFLRFASNSAPATAIKTRPPTVIRTVPGVISTASTRMPS